VEFQDIDRWDVYSAAGVWTDITAYVRPTRGDQAVQRGRQTELDQSGAGTGTLTIDDASGRFTPGSPYADLELTQGMPVRFYTVIGYRLFPICTMFVELPDTTEHLPGVDNLITVGLVDRKQLLDGSRTLISNLAEYIQAATTTLVCFYPLGDTAAPWLDVTGTGPPFSSELTYTSLGTLTAAATITPASGPMAAGDDMSGVAFAPTLAVQSSTFPTLAQGWRLTSEFDATAMTSFASGVPLTLVTWVSITGQYDNQNVLSVTFKDVATGLEVSTVQLQRLVQDAVAVPTDFGKVSAIWNWSGSGTTGRAVSTTQFVTTGAGMVPMAIQITINPNTLKLWVGSDEFSSTAVPLGAIATPQQLSGTVRLGALEGALSYFQIHVGSFSRADFLAQYLAGRLGLAQQRPDERIVSALWYAGASHSGVIDEGSTYMQQVSVRGKTAGQVIDNAVATERGRFFYDGAGNPVFHSRVRAYNL